MGTYSDFRTLPGMTANQSVGFLHGLGVQPDVVIITFRGTNFISTGGYNCAYTSTTTAVTITAACNDVTVFTPNLNVWTITAHSIIR